MLQLTLLGIAFNGATVFHAALVDQLAPSFCIAAFVRLRFIQIARHRVQLPS